MRKVLLLALLVVAACDFDKRFTAYCENNSLCGASTLPGGAGGGGSGGSAGSGGSGGSAGSGGVGGSAGSVPGWSAAVYCEGPNADQQCPEGKICNSAQHVCVKPCDPTKSDCRQPEPYCGHIGYGRYSCGCGNDADCTEKSPGTKCNGFNLLCEYPCRFNSDCEGYPHRPYCHVVAPKTSGWCVQCQSDPDCPASLPNCILPDTPSTDAGSYFACTICFRDLDCMDRGDGNHHCFHGECRP